MFLLSRMHANTDDLTSTDTYSRDNPNGERQVLRSWPHLLSVHKAVGCRGSNFCIFPMHD